VTRLTEKDYWESTYANDRGSGIVLGHWRSYTDTEVFRIIAPLLADAGSAIEIGAGDSMWLSFLARQFPESRFTGLDYSEAGCIKLSERLQREQASAQVVCADAFLPPAHLLDSADIALSFGVVEHFDDLAEVLTAFARLVRHRGTLFTLIPNMAGLLGTLTNRWNPKVYKLHVPHDLESFRAGHRRAGLEILADGYLGSSNFGVLSSCFDRQDSREYSMYKWLSRASKAAWLLESHGLPLPTSRLLSPYIYCISRRV
jgi:SAM-dependent methyltransferase